MEQNAAHLELTTEVKNVFGDALSSLRLFLGNPTGGLSQAFETLDDRRAMGVGGVFALVFIVCLLIFSARYINDMQGIISPSESYRSYQSYRNGSAPSGPGVAIWFKLFFAGLAPWLTFTAASAAARKGLRGESKSFGGDVFLAGASLIPAALFLLLAGMLGVGNIEVIAVLLLFAFCYTILLLFTGCLRISRISESGSALAVPLMLLLSGWLCKIIFAMILA